MNIFHSRHGITLTEVLISLGILTLGLLGVAAIFPVGSWYVMKAENADHGSAIAQSVMNDIITRGTIDPKSWYVMIPANLASPTHATIPTADGAYAPALVRTTFTRPFAKALSDALAQPAPASDPMRVKQFGSAFVIDPLFVAAATWQTKDSQFNPVAYAFPASAALSFPRNTGTWGYYQNSAWNPWRTTATPAGLNLGERVWPIRRVTFQDMTPTPSGKGWAMGSDLASHLFRGGDDLTTDLPTRADRPARQNWDTMLIGNQADPLARQRTGDYSWIVTVAPTTMAARNGLASNPESFSYDVSVVVFYKRVLPSEPAPNSASTAPAAATERMVGASVMSTGLNGGELLLTEIVDSTESPFNDLKAGNWVMLCGPHPNSTGNEPRFVLNWYQVLAIDGMEGRLNTKGTYAPAPASGEPRRRLVTVRGSEWPWKPTYDAGYGTSGLSNDLCVGIFRGAVAVHRKTIKLEGSYGDGMALVKP